MSRSGSKGSLSCTRAPRWRSSASSSRSSSVEGRCSASSRRCRRLDRPSSWITWKLPNVCTTASLVSPAANAPHVRISGTCPPMHVLVRKDESWTILGQLGRREDLKRSRSLEVLGSESRSDVNGMLGNVIRKHCLLGAPVRLENCSRLSCCAAAAEEGPGAQSATVRAFKLVSTVSER